MLGSDSKGSSGSQDSSGRQRRQTTKPSDTTGGGSGGGGSITGVRQDTGYSTESSDSRRSRTRKVNTEPSPARQLSQEILQNPFLAGVKSYSTSTGYEVRELEDLSELPSEYRELGQLTDSESEMRGSVVSGTDLTSYSAINLTDFQANRRAEIQAELSERA